MLGPQQRHRRPQAVLKSTLVAAWLSGAMLVGHLTQYVPLGGRKQLNLGQRSGTIVKGASPSQTFPSASPSNEFDAASAILGGLAAACVALAVAVRLQLPGPVVETSATEVSQFTLATQQTANIAVPQGVTIACAGVSAGLASVATTMVTLPGNQVTRSSLLQGEKVESLHVALTAEKPTRAAEATVTAEGIKDERSASLSPTAEACAPAAAMEMTTEVGVHDQKRSLGISAAHKVKRYALNPDARKTDEKTKLRQFLLSAPPPSKLGLRLA